MIIWITFRRFSCQRNRCGQQGTMEPNICVQQ